MDNLVKGVQCYELFGGIALIKSCLFLFRRDMLYEQERVLRVCDGFLCSISATYDGAVLLWQW